MIFEVIIDKISLLFTGAREVECQGATRTLYGKKATRKNHRTAAVQGALYYRIKECETVPPRV